MRGSAGNRGSGREHAAARKLLLASAAILPWHFDDASAQVLPQEGTVVSGQAVIGQPSGSQMTITQTSPKAVVDWNGFSVGQGSTVKFVQPSSSAAILNRVTGATPSTIAGQITADGQVFLVNPNGIAITRSGSVQVGGGFIASTLDILNADFNAGNFRFSGNGASANVGNAGVITTAPGGFVGLLGGSVSNEGTITVPLGKVGLGAGERATIDPTGDGFLQVALPTGAVGVDGRALIDVAGQIQAAGGSIEIRAATAQEAVRDAVNVSGALLARSVSGRGGSIVLSGDPGGKVAVSGTLLATGGDTEKGGTITVTGREIGLRSAIIDVSGGTGGGTVLIGGRPRGVGDLLRASISVVDEKSVIIADATRVGNGGNVTVWSDDATTFAGFIRARGGAQSGDGGQVEVSGKRTLSLTGDYGTKPLADLSAANGKAGTLLFDPGTVSILDQASLSGNSALNGPDTFTAQFVSGQLAFSNVTIDTNDATGANGTAGDINLLSGAQISWSSGNNLTLNAARSINFAAGASISGTGLGASLSLRADSGGTGIGTVSFAGGTQVSLPSGSVDLYYNPASNRTPANGGTNAASGTVNGVSYAGGSPASETWSSFVSAGTFSSWMLVNSVHDLQNINNNLGANYALGRNIDASATSAWNAGAGFVPLGTNGAGAIQGGGFTGAFDGLGKTISDLFIARGLANYAGLFGSNAGSVANVGLDAISVSGATYVGGLAGVNSGTISSSYASGTVSGLLSNVGGLVGRNAAGASITDSYALSTSGAIVSTVGGLVGTNDGSIDNSYAAGSTATLLFSGGLVGVNSLSGSISDSYFDTQSTGQLFGVGLGSAAGVTGLTTATFQNGSLPAGFDPSIWNGASGRYPWLTWQIPASPPPATTNVIITATDPFAGSPVYGNGAPAFGYTVTDQFGTVLCAADCSAYFTGTPLIDTTLSPTSTAGSSATAYIAQGSMAALSGYALQFVNDALTVVPRPLTITAANQSKTYGSVASLGSTAFTTNGLVNGDSVTGVTLASAGSGATATVAGGPYAIAASAAAGTGLSNYLLAYVDGLLTVTPAPVGVTALGGSSAYGSAPANPGLAVVGLQNGESASVLTGLFNSFGITGASAPGPYVLNVAGSLTNPNYAVAQANTGTWTVGAPPPGSAAAGSQPPTQLPAPMPPTPQGGTSPTGVVPQIDDTIGMAGPGDQSGLVIAPPAASPGAAAPAPASRAGASSARQSSDVPPARAPAEEPAKPNELRAALRMAGCHGGASGDASAGQNRDCADSAATKDAALPALGVLRLDRRALYAAIDRQLSELRNAANVSDGVVSKIAAVTSIVVTAGFLSWLLQSGALLNALVSSMPLWRGFDPLVVFLRPKRRRKDREPPSRVEFMFDRAGGGEHRAWSFKP